MPHSLGTTAAILAWCALYSGAWSLAVYGAPLRVPRRGLLLPAVIVAPLAVLLAYRGFSVHLLFPSALNTPSLTLFLAAAVPAAVLFLTSGLCGTLAREVQREYTHWQAQPFAIAAVAYGQTKSKVLRRLVLPKAMSNSWAQCLPWVYGELLVVEAVFNAPGLGLTAWHQARSRDQAGLIQTIFYLSLLYLLSVAASAFVTRRLGRRLASYG